MKILHVLDHSLPLHSGYTFRTEAIVREQMRIGWQPYMMTTPKQGKCEVLTEDFSDLRFYRTPATGAESLLTQIRLTKHRILELAEEIRPNVIHAHSPVLNALPAISAGKKLNIPVVYEIRAFWEDAAVDHGTIRQDGPRYMLSRMLETWAVKRADAVTLICEGLRNDIVSRGVPAAKLTVIPNAVNPEKFKADSPVDRDLVQKLALDGHIVLGFIGSFYHYEGLHFLIDALRALIDRGHKIKLLLVGGGEQEAQLKSRAARLGLVNEIVFTGRVPNSDVGRFYSVVDILVYPRISMRLTELVTPLKPLEAMAQGRLFLASDVGGHKELVVDGETGFLFKANDLSDLCASLERCLALPDSGQKIRSNARRFIETQRTWSKSVEKYRTAYALAESNKRSKSLS